MNKGVKLTIIYIILAASIASTYLIVTNTHSCGCLNKIFFWDIQNQDLTTQNAKWVVIRSLLAKIALFLFVHAISIMTIRIFAGKTSPATQEDPTAIKLVNRIITNTIEQSIVFVGFYVYFIFDRAGDRFNSTQLLVFASWFLLARVIFTVTYLFGSLIGFPNLRAFGFALNVVIIHLLVELTFVPVQPLTGFIFGK